MASESTPRFCLLSCLVLAPVSTLLQAEPGGYYQAVDASSAESLRHSLHEIIDDHQRFPYTAADTDTWDVLEIADEHQGNDSEIITIYRNASYPKQGGGNDFYNREHTWPNSYGFPDDGPDNYPFTDMHALFLAWFTYDTERPPPDVRAILGEPGHRWMTAQGSYNGDTADLTVYVSSGGVLDSAEPPVGPPENRGTMQVHFSGCNAGEVRYDIPSLGLHGEVPIQRIVQDNVPFCESIRR